jgi:hypothetical protein
MRYFKFLDTEPLEYYAVAEDNEPFWWYSHIHNRWMYTGKELWNQWYRRDVYRYKDIVEVSPLEVLVILGSVKE